MSDEDVPQLSAETFAALQEFYKEQEAREQNLITIGTDNHNISFPENWQLSQFWYDDVTTQKLVEIALKSIESKGKIALISCPTLYKQMKHSAQTDYEVTLFEYDRRFSVYGDGYIFYDYKTPLGIPRDKANYYDLVIADPPFLSEECLTKTAITIKYLAKQKIMLCTGAVMEDLACRLLDLKKSSFIPRHKNNLSNEFACYSNYNLDNFLK